MDAHTSSSNTTGSAPSPHQAGMDAIDQVLARLELSPEGQILDANPHFLTIMGYPLDELKGKHHGMLLSPDEAQSATYDTFWETLRSGTSQESEFHLLDKQGRDIWIRGACSPVLDAEGQLTRIIIYAMDLTGQKQLTASFEGQLNALSRVMGKVEFSLDGTILDANP
ncbi:MAG: PAS domain-containing protein, partial [Aeromonas sp.]|nr:PAS domain-containing protein [Aeromonas sp.]